MEMSSLEIWGYIFGGAAIFATVLGIFSVWNGRMTRRELTEVTKRAEARTQTLIRETAERTNENIKKIDDHETDGRPHETDGRAPQRLF
ncbi:MAG: hypothetical protein AB1742_06540 [bacterium]